MNVCIEPGPGQPALRRSPAPPFYHPLALVDPGATVGPGTRVWAYAHLLPGSVVGDDCNICDHTFIEGAVVVGNRVTIKCGVFLWDGITVEDDVFIGPGATLTNDMYPRSRQYPSSFAKTVLQCGCSIGANAVILAGLTIGRWASVAAGSVVTRNVPAFGLVVGNPARLRSWVCKCGRKLQLTFPGRTQCTCQRAYRLSSTHVLEEETNGN